MAEEPQVHASNSTTTTNGYCRVVFCFDEEEDEEDEDAED